MRAKIKDIISPDIDDLSNYIPSDASNFGFLLQLLIGPEDEKGSESFDMVVCTPQWLIDNHAADEIIIGRHYLIVFKYDYERIMQKINTYLVALDEDTWTALAQKIARLGKWEFEDYKP